MLTIRVVLSESFDDEKQEFVEESVQLELEHSLVSLSKWEAKYEKPFLNDEEKTTEEVLFYIECMILTPNYDPELLELLSSENLEEINKYINSKMTATWFPEEPKRRPSPETITSELIYYWMIAMGIPFEAETWHLNRLLTLVQVCNVKNTPKDKVDKRKAALRRAQLNAERKARFGTTG